MIWLTWLTNQSFYNRRNSFCLYLGKLIRQVETFITNNGLENEKTYFRNGQILVYVLCVAE